MKFLPIALVSFLIINLTAGLATLSFKKTSGVITSSSLNEVRGGAYPSQHGYEGNNYKLLNVTYRYEAAGNTIQSSRVSFWILDVPGTTYLEGMEVPVYYSGWFPEFSVLHRGPDKWVVIITLLFCMTYFWFKGLMSQKFE